MSGEVTGNESWIGKILDICKGIFVSAWHKIKKTVDPTLSYEEMAQGKDGKHKVQNKYLEVQVGEAESQSIWLS